MSHRRFIFVSALCDALLLNAGMVAAFLVRFGGELPSFNFAAYLLVAPAATLVYLGTLWAYGLYDPERSETTWTIVRSVVVAVTLGMTVEAALAFFGGERTASFARLAFLLGWVFDIVLLVGWRLVFFSIASVQWPEQRVLLIGTGPVSVELAQELERRHEWGWRVCGFLESQAEDVAHSEAQLAGHPILGPAAAAGRIAREQNANRIIVVSPVALRELIESLVLEDELSVRVDVVPELYEIFIGSVDALVGDIPLMQITSTSVPRYYAAMKRAIDIVGAAILLILSSPILLVACIAIAVEDGFPVTFSQERVGRRLKNFPVHKLRTMRKDAEQTSGPVLAEEDDPRITRVGRVLRQYRIDELPQVFNILRGEMSFVGPRPERPFFVDTYLADISGYRERFRIKPGVTGLAQVSGGYATTPERKLKYDLIYLYHRSFAMDAQIVAETLKVVLTGKGAR